MSEQRDRIAQMLMASAASPDAYTVPLPWPMPPGEQLLRGIPPNERDLIERAPVMEGQDLNAIRGEDLMQQYFWPELTQEDI